MEDYLITLQKISYLVFGGNYVGSIWLNADVNLRYETMMENENFLF